MKKLGIAMLALAAGSASLPVYAMDMGNAVRFGAGMGRYGIDFSAQGLDNDGNVVVPENGFTNVELTYGGELGYTFSMSDFYADLGLNFLRTKQDDDLTWRTDLLFTVGYYITDNWSVFAGLRRGWQGDGLFNEDKFQELGPYVGFGYGGIPLGKWGALNTSFAYNFDRVSELFDDIPNVDSGKSFSYPGLSLKLGINFTGTPHSIQLRLQRFAADDSVNVVDGGGAVVGRIDFELEETWAVLSYVYTLAW